MKINSLCILLLSTLSFYSASGQLYPVQVTTQLVPPYSVYLSDYATPGNEKLRLLITQRDVTKTAYRIRLKFSLELNGRIVLQTSRFFNPPPITLPPGEPISISGADLQSYLDSRNLDFTGINQEEYERTKTLPEGNYQICFTAYDYSRQDVPVSLAGCQSFWLDKSEPPLLNLPACGAAIELKTPQQVVFSWMPRNNASPNSAGQTQYEFDLYEIRPAGRNPNDVVFTSQPIFHTTTTETQIIYGMAEPILLENLQYAWRVKAIDLNGKDQYRNNGYSETCHFTYGGSGSNVQLLPVEDFHISGTAERRADAFWASQSEAEGYQLAYRKKKGAYQWVFKQTPKDSTAIPDLDPDTEYEARVQAYVGANYGPYSDVEKFKTLKAKVLACGDSVAPIKTSATPLAYASAGMIIDVQGIDLTLDKVEGPSSGGLFKGKGTVSIEYFGGAIFHVEFNDLFIDENQVAARGHVTFITKGLDKWVDDELKEQKKKQQKENREQYKGKKFYEKTIHYDDIAIHTMEADSAGNIVITDDKDEKSVNTEIPAILKNNPGKAIIIEDKNGDQWVVEKDPDTGAIKVTKVPGGGLSPNMNVFLSEEATGIVEEALTYLSEVEYSSEALATLEATLQNMRKEITPYTANGSDQDSTYFQAVSLPAEDVENTDKNKDPDVMLKNLLELLDAQTKAEKIRNRGVLVRLLGSMKEDPDLIALLSRELKLPGGEHISEYITSRKRDHISDDAILADVKESIRALVDQIIIDKFESMRNK